MNILRREDVGNLLEHIAEELVCEVVARAEQFVRHAAGCAHRHLALVASEFGEHADGSHLVSRHLYLRHDIHVILSAQLHQFAHLLLRVVALVRHLNVVLTPARRSLLRELWVFLYLDAPSLVVNQMEVHGVELIARHLGHERLQILERYERACRVNHQFANVRARFVADEQRRDGVGTLRSAVAAQQLVERHERVEHAARCLALRRYALGVYSERVRLVVAERVVDRQRNLCAALTTVHDVADALCEHASSLCCLVRESVGSYDVPRGLHLKVGALQHLQFYGERHEAVLRLAHLIRLLSVAEEEAPARSLAVEFFAALRHDELHVMAVETVERCSVSLRRHLRVDAHGLQTRESCEGVLSNLRSALYCYLLQRRATRECGSAYALYASRNGYLAQLVACEERLRTYRLRRCRQRDLLELVARVESVVRDSGALRLAEVYGAHLETEVAQLTIVAVARRCQFARELEAYSHRLLLGLQVVHACYGLRRNYG